MPVYELEQYELHTSKYRVKAECEADAVIKLLDGEGEMVNNSLEFIDVAEDVGMSAEDHPKLLIALRRRGRRHADDIIPSIRSIAIL